MDNHIVAFFDLLGFKVLVEQSVKAADAGDALLQDFRAQSRASQPRATQGNGVSWLQVPHLHR